VQSGTVNVVISGGGAGRNDDEVAESTAKQTVIRKGAGWLFGVLTLLFESPRSASVVAHDAVVTWSLDRSVFLAFVLKHAMGARAVRFLRKLPLLSGLTDDKLVDIASRVKEEVYETGEFLINAGDRADGLYVIRCACACCCQRHGSALLHGVSVAFVAMPLCACTPACCPP
jgi:cGMP-dependent protein kinase 1